MTMSSDEYKTVISQLMESNKLVRESNEDQKKMVSLLIKTCESQQEMMKKMFDSTQMNTSPNTSPNTSQSILPNTSQQNINANHVETHIKNKNEVEEVKNCSNYEDDEDEEDEEDEVDPSDLFDDVSWIKIKHDISKNKGYILMSMYVMPDGICKYLDITQITSSNPWSYDMIDKYYKAAMGNYQIAITIDKFLDKVKPYVQSPLSWSNKLVRSTFIELLDNIIHDPLHVSLKFRAGVDSEIPRLLRFLYHGLYDESTNILTFTRQQYKTWAPIELVGEFYVQ